MTLESKQPESALVIKRLLVDELLYREPTVCLARVDRADQIAEKIKVHLEPGEYAFFRSEIGGDDITLIYLTEADLPNIYHRITGKVPEGYHPVPMTADERYVDNSFDPRTYHPLGIRWMAQEYVTERDPRPFIGWSDWPEENRHDYLDKRYPAGRRYKLLNEAELTEICKDGQAHRKLIEDLKALGFIDFAQVMACLRRIAPPVE